MRRADCFGAESGCTFKVGNTTTSATSTTYTSTQGFSITYPSDWGKPQELEDGFVGFATPIKNESENLNVQVVNLSASDTLETVKEDVISNAQGYDCLLYTSDAADDLLCVDLGGRRIIKKKKNNH